MSVERGLASASSRSSCSFPKACSPNRQTFSGALRRALQAPPTRLKVPRRGRHRTRCYGFRHADAFFRSRCNRLEYSRAKQVERAHAGRTRRPARRIEHGCCMDARSAFVRLWRLHALGPGHGKIVISAYLASHRARFIDAVALSVWSAFVQALSAILLVNAAAWLSREGLSGVLTRASGLELTSYIALLGVGAWTLWSIVTRRDCCDIDRVELVSRKRLSVAAKRDVDGGDEREASYLGSSLGQRRYRTSRTSRRSWTPMRTGADRSGSRGRSS